MYNDVLKLVVVTITTNKNYKIAILAEHTLVHLQSTNIIQIPMLGDGYYSAS